MLLMMYWSSHLRLTVRPISRDVGVLIWRRRVRWSGLPAQGLGENWDGVNKQTVARLRAALEPSGLRRFSGTKRTSAKVGDLAKIYLRKRAEALRPGGYKSCRHSIGLFVSKYANVPVSQRDRDEGRAFPETTPLLSKVIRKSVASAAARKREANPHLPARGYPNTPASSSYILVKHE